MINASVNYYIYRVFKMIISQNVKKRRRRHTGLVSRASYFQTLLDSCLRRNDENWTFCDLVKLSAFSQLQLQIASALFF